jgi:acetamidase/formamidase
VYALQGDGVVDQTAIETAAEDLAIRYDLHKGVPLRGPLGETKTAWIVIGFGANLDDALLARLRETIGWLAAAAQITEPEVYSLASMAMSFRVTQYANQTRSAYSSVPAKAVHVVIPKAIFPAVIRYRIGAWLRPAGPTP